MPRPTSQGRRRSRDFGRRSELLAALWLMLKGYRILERNYLAGGGEIDLIAQKGPVIALVEVKARSNFDAALLAIDRRKLEQITKAARFWLSSARAPEALVLRFDVVLVAPRRLPRHIPNIAELPRFA